MFTFTLVDERGYNLITSLSNVGQQDSQPLETEFLFILFRYVFLYSVIIVLTIVKFYLDPIKIELSCVRGGGGSTPENSITIKIQH